MKTRYKLMPEGLLIIELIRRAITVILLLIHLVILIMSLMEDNLESYDKALSPLWTMVYMFMMVVNNIPVYYYYLRQKE